MTDDQSAGPDWAGPGDARLLARSISDRWPMTAAIRAQVLQYLVNVVDPDYLHELRQPTFRERLAAVRALQAADQLNLGYLKLERAHPADDPANVRDAVAEAEAADAALDLERQREGTADAEPA